MSKRPWGWHRSSVPWITSTGQVMPLSISSDCSTVSTYSGPLLAATWSSPVLSRAQPVTSSNSLVECGVLQSWPKKKSTKSVQSSRQWW